MATVPTHKAASATNHPQFRTPFNLVILVLLVRRRFL
jgi:hypothetical protein